VDQEFSKRRLGDAEAEAKCEISVRFLTFSRTKFCSSRTRAVFLCKHKFKTIPKIQW